jgi:glyoxylase I family protein
MPEVIGIDHVYLTVSDLAVSEHFYDLVLARVLQFRRNSFTIGGDPHVQYYNRHFGIVLRPARTGSRHDSYAPGLHHLCVRVDSAADVRETAEALRAQGLDATEVKPYPDYAPDYVATFVTDPDGIRLEITNYRDERRQRHDHWTENP